jgi:hypothetical protein
MKSIGVFLLGVLAAIYLINPTAGIFELLPDNIPFVGNLDEAAAAALLIEVLQYFGVNTHFFSLRKPKKPPTP